ncbi:hypothetical protein ACFQPA_16165 [Halomarina halobia]|uniref:2,4-diaminopentanoate dehydrogenase C-terminal domain-containing protein n=1 Tax=Halomarina halobia TaxID=3033386 RepID=A0ABD6AF45_9EURY|nr:hypothetical protein [Halomarina sp. PSR21]
MSGNAGERPRLTAVQYGVGPIGSRIVRVAVDRGIEFVGGIDIDPTKVGRDLGRVVGLERDLGVDVTDDAQTALEAEPDVVFHSTGSSLAAVSPQLTDALTAEADVISTTEELSYPWWDPDNRGLASELDETAREHGVTCLGTGINPGFAMDTLPAVLSTPCQVVQSIRVERVQDAAQRRRPLQEKIGAGLDVETFEREIATAGGHVGLSESTAMLADALGWTLQTTERDIEPVIADERVRSDYVTVDPGAVAGIRQRVRGIVDGDAVIELDLRMYLDAPDPHDRIRITGRPPLDVVVAGGFHGDRTTPAIVVNVVPRVRAAAPGVATMLDLAVPSYTRAL